MFVQLFEKLTFGNLRNFCKPTTNKIASSQIGKQITSISITVITEETTKWAYV